MTGTSSGTKTDSVKTCRYSHTWKVISLSGSVPEAFTFSVVRVF
jgi:hypothetical protein